MLYQARPATTLYSPSFIHSRTWLVVLRKKALPTYKPDENCYATRKKFTKGCKPQQIPWNMLYNIIAVYTLLL